MRKKLLTFWSLVITAMFMLPGTANAWNDVYLNCGLSSWGNSDSYKFTKVNDNEFYYTLPVSNITGGDFYFRYSVDPSQSWGQSNWGPKTDGDAISATDYPNASMNNSGAFKIAQNANATSCTIRIKYNNSTGSWTWHVTAEIVAPDVPKTEYSVTFNDPGWDKVYAYIWNGGTDSSDDAAQWPGKQLTKSGNAYTFTYEAYSAPGNIIFNNGDNGKQTPDLTFTDGATYTNVFSIIGGESFLGEWNTSKSLDMTEGTDGKWTLTIEDQELSTGSFEYKAIYNHDWGIKEFPAGGGNNTQSVNKDAKYDITFTLDPNAESDQLTCKLTEKEEVVIEHTYTVVGNLEDLFGAEWDPTAEANDMTKGDDGVYTWKKEGVTITSGYKIEYKVAQDHAWTVSYPDGNADYTEYLGGGIYTVTITFNPATSAVACDLTKTADLPQEKKDFTVKFNDPKWDEVYAYAWSGEGESAVAVAAWPGTKLTKTGDVYTYTVNAVSAPENIIFNNGDGKGKQTPDLKFEADKTYTHVYSIVGEGADFLGGWDATKAIDMTEGEDGKWTLTKEVEFTETTSIQYKAIYDHAFDVSYGKADGSNQDYNDIEAGKYTATFTLDLSAEGDKVNAQFEKAVEPITVYTIVGEAPIVNGGNWDLNNKDNEMTKGEDGKYTLKLENIQLTSDNGYSYKVVGNHNFDAFQIPLVGNQVITVENNDYVQNEYYDLLYTLDLTNNTLTLTLTHREAPKQDYTVTFVNTGKWAEVAAYTWTGETTQAGEWPGKKLEKTGTAEVDGQTYDVYTLTLNLTAAPEKIIFNDNKKEGATQTDDLDFVADKQYSYEVPPTYTVTFVNTDKWAEVAAYAWTTEGETTTNFAGEWPGTKLEKTGTKTIDGTAYDVYTWSYTGKVAPARIIFNENKSGEGVKQTEDYQFVDGKEYSMALPEYTVTFVNTGDWAEVAAYAWSGDGDDATKFAGEWPGKKLTANGEKVDGHDVYSYTVQAAIAPEKIIFNDNKAEGATQTEDLEFVDGKQYSYVAPKTITATFVNTGDWAKVYAWAWTTVGEGDDAQTTNFSGEWPGVELTEKAAAKKDGHDVYTFTYTGRELPASILFHNGEGTQTEDFELVDKKEYQYTAPEKNFKAYFVNMAGWETVKAHAWNAEGNLTTWPGDAVEAADKVAPYGTDTDTYVAAFEKQPTQIIFNNGDNGEQTGDMTFLQEAYYTYDGLTSTSKLLFLDIDKEYTIAEKTAITGMSVCYPRQFTVGQKSTVCLPFALTEEQAADAGKFYALKSVSASEVKYEEVTATEANTPYLFIAAAEYPFENVSVSELPATVLKDVERGGAKLFATLEKATFTTDTETTYFGYDATNGKWTKATVGTLRPFRACLAVPSSSAAAKAFQLDDNFNATGINAIEAEIEKGAVVYDMQGRRVNTPARGIYIMNGKKYVVK